MDSTLAALLDDTWRGLVRAAADRRHPWRTPVLATVAADGAPNARTVVLRAADPATRTLRLHTDRRSAKAAELARDPRVTLVFWDPRARVQLRLRGRAEVLHEGPEHARAWAATPPAARRDYATRLPPGTPIAAREDVAHGDGAANFAVIRVRVMTIDRLALAAEGHLRAGFAWEGDEPRATWLVP